MIIYAIKDLSTETFVTNDWDLDILGDTTMFFDDMPRLDDLTKRRYIYQRVAMKYLAKLNKADEWDLEVDSDTLKQAIREFKLKVVKCEIKEVEIKKA